MNWICLFFNSENFLRFLNGLWLLNRIDNENKSGRKEKNEKKMDRTNRSGGFHSGNGRGNSNGGRTATFCSPTAYGAAVCAARGATGTGGCGRSNSEYCSAADITTDAAAHAGNGGAK